MAGASNKNADSIDVRLLQLDQELTHLHQLYEQHFAGVIKLEPAREHSQFKKKLSLLTPAEIKTTAAKFRLQTIQARYLQQQKFWEKIQRQIEEGTYKRDLFLLQKKIERSSDEPSTPTAKAASSAATQQPTVSKMQKQLEDLYEKVRSASASPEKIPNKEKFMASIQKEITRQNEKYPGKPISIGLAKDASGQIQIKIGTKKA